MLVPIKQQAPVHGANPPENTYRSLVDWASKIEARIKQTKTRSIATTQWLAEGKGVKNPEPKPQSQLRCFYCKEVGHTIQNCFRLKTQKPHSKNDNEILKHLGKLVIKNNTSGDNAKETEEQTQNPDSPYKNLQTDLANLLAIYSNPQ